MTRTVEIERKFLVPVLPDADRIGDGVEITQGYLAVEERREVRIRRSGGRCWLTVKGGRGLVRAEHEVELDREQFDRLWPATEPRRVVKTRFTIPLGDLTAELDRYAGELDGLMTVEVEFPSETAAAAFEPPPWFGREVTGDERFANQRLAVDGMPRSD